MEQQRAKIQRQLKNLRQESVKDYLSEKLDSLASKQVVNDILHQFLTNHDEQFLSNIANSIATVKIQCKQLKSQLKLKQQNYQEFQKKLKNELKNQYETKNQSLLNQWTMLQILCQQKIHQRNPRKAVEKVVQHLAQVLQKKQILQKSVKQLEQNSADFKEYHKKQIERLILGHKNIQQKERGQNQQLKKILEMNVSVIQKLKEQLYKSQKNNQAAQQKIISSQAQYKKSHQLLQFLQSKVCEQKQSSVRMKYELQLAIKDRQNYQYSIIKSKSESACMNQQILKCRSLLNQNSLKLSECEKQLQNLKEIRIKEQSARNSQIKNLSQQIIYLKKQSLMQKAQLEAERSLKNQNLNKYQELLKSYQNLSLQQGQLKKLFSTKQTTFKSYVLQKDHQIKIVQEQLQILRAQLDQSQQRQAQYEQYLLQLNELKNKLRKLQPSYQQADVQITFEEGKGFRQKHHLLRINNKKTKIYYLHKNLKTKSQNLKNQLIQVKQKNKQELQSFRSYVTSMIKFLIQKSNQQKIMCSYCQHKSAVQKNMIVKGRKDEQQRMQKYLQKTTKIGNQIRSPNNCYQQQYNLYGHGKPTTTKWSKQIRNLNQKFKTIDSQNKEYKLHLNNILNQHK